MNGIIFNIQRYSLSDGPGIRTTVFLKGCPLRCEWCHNPESIDRHKSLILRSDRCVMCGDCLDICEQHAIRSENGKYVTERGKCIECGRCVEACNAEARGLIGRELTADELVDEIAKDTVFFNESGGGVTFSGGEPLLQHEFLLSVLKECGRKNIDTAIDTSGYAPPEILEPVSSAVDLFLYDLKTLDDAAHRKFTGVSNNIILENLRRLAGWNKNVIIRIPVIPGINDDLQSIRLIGGFAGSLKNIREIHLLPFHADAFDKYRKLGIEFPAVMRARIPDERIREFADELKKYVNEVIVGGLN